MGPRHVILHCAISLSVWSAGLAGSQAPPAGALTGALRTHLAEERLDVVTAVRGLPLGVRQELQALFSSHALEIATDIADAGGKFQPTGVAGTQLPMRRLVAAGCSVNYCLVYYERGGSAHTWHVGLFYWTPEATRLEWGAAAPGGLKTLAEVRAAVLSGAIKGPNKVW
ncbi:MAG TPA: hypothetical protein VN700_00770 [Vicinamibacterales bacterium]|nr:hypothetical protein [Vicinamibacterales bacterium]